MGLFALHRHRGPTSRDSSTKQRDSWRGGGCRQTCKKRKYRVVRLNTRKREDEDEDEDEDGDGDEDGKKKKKRKSKKVIPGKRCLLIAHGCCGSRDEKSPR